MRINGNGNVKVPNYIYIAPGGFTMPYTLGICRFIKEHYSLEEYNVKYIGSSAGSWLSVYLASDMFLTDKIIKDYSKLFENRGIWYKWNNICPFLIKEFPKYIDDHSFVYQKKIKVSISHLFNKTITNEIVDDYNNLNELLNLCSYSSYIPILSGLNVPRRNNIITFDGYFSEPDFKNRKVLLKIENGMFNRHFTFNDVIGKSKININELVNLGYYDSIMNKNKLDEIFL
jgi:hypothetical protein